MVKRLLVFLLLLAVVLGALWYWLYRPQAEALEASQREATRLKGDAERSAHRVAALETQVADLQSVREELQRASTDLQQRVKQKEDELAAQRSTQDELLSELKKEIDDQRVSVQRFRDQLRVDMVDEVLFDSGQAELKEDGKRILRRVGAVLKKAQNRRIEIQGHTDNVPIVGALAKRFATNWELSAARAVGVARFLQDDAGVDPKRLSASGYSEYRPRTPNDTDDARRKNRRIEILLVPIPPEPDAAASPAPTSSS
jgi:chemotaxis protein MotB